MVPMHIIYDQIYAYIHVLHISPNDPKFSHPKSYYIIYKSLVMIDHTNICYVSHNKIYMMKAYNQSLILLIFGTKPIISKVNGGKSFSTRPRIFIRCKSSYRMKNLIFTTRNIYIYIQMHVQRRSCGVRKKCFRLLIEKKNCWSLSEKHVII